MPLAAPDPLLDAANDHAIAATLTHVAGALAGTCAALRGRDGDAAAARLDRCRLALGYITRASVALSGETVTELPPHDSTRPLTLHAPHFEVPTGNRDPRLKGSDRYHPGSPPIGERPPPGPQHP